MPMRTCVTGSSGYIGSALFRRLVESTDEPDRVSGIDKSPGSCTTILQDLADGETSLPPTDIVYHLAGLFVKGFGERAVVQTDEFERDNVETMRSIIEFAGVHDVHVVFASTLLLSEKPLPTDPYTKTKGTAEELLYSCNDISSTICRLPRVLGLGAFQSELTRPRVGSKAHTLPKDIVSWMIEQLQTKGRIEITGASLMRSYIYLDEAVEGLEACSSQSGLVDGRLYEPITIGRIAEIVADVARRFSLSVSVIFIPREIPARRISTLSNCVAERVIPRFSCTEDLIESVASEYLSLLKDYDDDKACTTHT